MASAGTAIPNYQSAVAKFQIADSKFQIKNHIPQYFLCNLEFGICNAILYWLLATDKGGLLTICGLQNNMLGLPAGD